ncbi:MAG: DNRLRE domain-containing protein [Propionibacteriaceae bacterium]|jgi:hypothetical protein|nr:DNRLRE domain-containing protein [Propionibacteriaceae bacterium]
MRKIVCALAVSLALVGCSTAPVETEKETPVTTQSVTTTPEQVVSSWISQADPENLGSDVVGELRASGEEGKREIALVHFELPAAVTAEQVAGASITLKTTAEGEPTLGVGYVKELWSDTETTWALSEALEPVDAQVNAAGQSVTIDATEIVKAWLAGERENAGVYVASMGKEAEFAPAGDDDGPQLELTYHPHGEPAPFTPAKEADGNCLGYAMGVKENLYADEIGMDAKRLQREYDKGGVQAGLDYFAAVVFDYFKENGVEYVPLAGFQAPVPEGFYRVAMRVGFHDIDAGKGIQVDSADFDYHFRKQLADGSWAEKLAEAPSRIVPGSNIELDPGRYPWDAAVQWGTPRFGGFYDSATVYFALKEK